MEYRKSVKKPMTAHAVKLLISKLNGMTASIPEQIEILNQSIVNGWQGIFPLKKEIEKPKTPIKKNNFNSIPQRDYDMVAMERMLLMQDRPADDTNDPAFVAQAEELKERLGQKYGKR
jgi:hypothetical protein